MNNQTSYPTGLSVCVNTQTPLVRFAPGLFAPSPDRPSGDQAPVVDLEGLRESVDYSYSPGGVTRMVYPLLKRLLRDGVITEAQWVSLNPTGPPIARNDGIVLHSINLSKESLNSYGQIKEAIWKAAHGMSGDGPGANELFWSEDFPGFAFYNRSTAELIRKLDQTHDFDLFYIHDFQQLPIGHMLTTLKPKIFRWHIPFDETMIPKQWTESLVTYFNSYDLVIASADKYLTSLKQLGYSGRVRKLYPFVDPTEYSVPTQEEVDSTADALGIKPTDRVVLCVARMDPMKGQDRAVRALGSIAPKYPDLRLVLVGNGSFSSSKGGLGLSKSDVWREELRSLATKLGVEDRIIMAGHVPQKGLDAMYERCAFTLLPSIREGFGLVVVESWLHRKATLVTERAGVSELIEERKNGMTFDPDDVPSLVDKMGALLDDKELASRLGANGSATAKVCTLDEGVKAEKEVITELVET